MKNIKMILTHGFYSDPRVFKEAKYYVSQGNNVEVLCWDRECKYDIDEDREGVKIHRFHIPAEYGSGMKKQIFAYFKFKKECIKYLKKQKFDILHCHDLDGAIIGLGVKNKVKKVFDMHEYYLASKNKYKNLILKHYVEAAQNKFDYIIYLNDKQKNDVDKKNYSKLRYIPNYPDGKIFYDIEKTPSDKIRISFIGNVRYKKANLNIIECCKKFKDLEMHFYGYGTVLDELKKYESDNVVFHGPYQYNELNDIYKNVDIINCVYDTTSNDGFPNKYFEAFITRTPLLVDVKSVRSKPVKEYDVGFLVDVNDIGTYEKVFKELTENREILQQKIDNFKNVDQKYSWEDVVKELDTITQ